MNTDIDTDVVVVGAGPAGLMLAGELRLGGARVMVLERLREPSGQSRGLGFTTRTVEIFDQRGLLPLLGNPERSRLGHFGGMQFDYGELEDADFGARGVPQHRTEECLATWAVGLGADLRRGWDVRDLVPDDSGVEVVADTPDGERRVHGRYLVGTDGGHSTVRRLAGFAFPGTAATRQMYLADVTGAGIRPRFLGERRPGGMVMAAPLAPGTDRIIIVEDGSTAGERKEVPTFGELADRWERLTGEDIHGARATWIGSFTDRTRQATEYRRGRVLLAGDAAHVHLPAGGQGLSTGVQDAMNLGWKLAAEVAGHAPADLLDTYHSERHSVGQRLLMNTRAQGMLFVGGPDMDPLRSLMSELVALSGVRRHLAGIVSGLDIRYDVGNSHPLAGSRLPPRTLTVIPDPDDPNAGPRRVSTAELLHGGRGLLLDLTGEPGTRKLGEGWEDRVVTVTAEADDVLGPGTGPLALLVRPDGYIAWAGSAGAVPDGLPTALRRWFGEPGPAWSPPPARSVTLGGEPMSLIDEPLAGSLTERLRQMIDRDEITRLADRYVLCLDAGRDDDAWLETVFTPDVRMSFPMGSFEGMAGLQRFQQMARSNFAHSHHLAGNYGIEVDGDTAQVRAHLLAVHVADDPATHFDIGGHYDAEAVRTPEGWRLRSLDFRLVWSSGPMPEAAPHD